MTLHRQQQGLMASKRGRLCSHKSKFDLLFQSSNRDFCLEGVDDSVCSKFAVQFVVSLHD